MGTKIGKIGARAYKATRPRVPIWFAGLFVSVALAANDTNAEGSRSNTDEGPAAHHVEGSRSNTDEGPAAHHVERSKHRTPRTVFVYACK